METEPGTTFWEWTGTRGQVDARFCSLVADGFIEARVEKKKDGYDIKINAPKGMELAG